MITTPWRADKMPGGYVVRDANGQAPAYIYSRDSEAEALQAMGAGHPAYTKRDSRFNQDC
jgi:hypothetical protein